MDPTIEMMGKIIILVLITVAVAVLMPLLMPKDEDELYSGMYECFHCGERAVIWGGDFNFEDFGYIGEGIVHQCYCNNCGAEVLYLINLEEEDEDGDTQRQYEV